MVENKCKSLENLLSSVPANLSQTHLPMQLETHRRELHREMATHWPFHTDTLDSVRQTPGISKSTARSSIRDGGKPNSTPGDKDSLHATKSHSRTTNVTPASTIGLHGKQAERKTFVRPTASDFSIDEHDQSIDWHFNAQEGVIRYQLPDNLPDSVALHNKLQKLMKTNTIYLNDRRFWSILENRFKILRKQNFQENMQHLRQSQKDYEAELISKGVMPSTTEQAIKQYAEQQHGELTVHTTDANNSHRKKCSIDYHRSAKPFEELEAFETDNVHPRFHEILSDYQFQTEPGKELGEQFADDLHKAQTRVKTIFPRINQRDRIRQELQTVKTSEGLYAYSNRLAKQVSK